MNQQSFAEMEYANKRRQTRREQFLEQMEKLIPWKRLESKIAPFYPNSGGPGKRKTMEEGSDALMAERAKALVQSKVEHPFHWV